MKDIIRNELGAPKIVDRSAFQAELDALRVREKAHTRKGDAIAAARRRLPMVEVDGTTPLIGERGAVTLLDAFCASFQTKDHRIDSRQKSGLARVREQP